MDEWRDYYLSGIQRYALTPHMASAMNLEGDIREEHPLVTASLPTASQVEALLRPLREEVGALVGAIRELVELVREQVDAMGGMRMAATEGVAAARDMTRDEAKREIQALFAESGETLYYSDVAERLGLGLRLVVELCDELEEEGEIVNATP